MIQYTGMTKTEAEAYRRGAPDAYGNAPERLMSSGSGMPCRHCLDQVPAGTEALVLAHRPFDGLHAYTESGPVFLCADACSAPAVDTVPPNLGVSPDYLIKGYTADERIAYGTGAVVPQDRLEAEIAARLDDPALAFVDIRSARNNCWLMRATRA